MVVSERFRYLLVTDKKNITENQYELYNIIKILSSIESNAFI